MRFYVASEEDLLNGIVTDIYFERTVKILRTKNLRKKVRVEFHSMSLPGGYEWAVFTGLEEALKLLEGKPVNVYAMDEGTIFKAGEPLMIIEGYLDDFILFETALLGIIGVPVS